MIPETPLLIGVAKGFVSRYTEYPRQWIISREIPAHPINLTVLVAQRWIPVRRGGTCRITIRFADQMLNKVCD